MKAGRRRGCAPCRCSLTCFEEGTKTMSVLAPLGGSAFGPATDGTSGRGPILSLAMPCSPPRAARPYVRAPACVRFLLRELHRSFHTRAGRLGLAGRSDDSGYPAAASLLSGRGTPPAVRVFVRENYGWIWRSRRVRTLTSRAIYCAASGLSEIPLRIRGRCATSLVLYARVISTTWLCIARNKTSGRGETPASLRRIARMRGTTSPFKKPTCYGGLHGTE